MEDLAGLGKLGEVLRQALGPFFEATIIRRNAKARADELKLLSGAARDAGLSLETAEVASDGVRLMAQGVGNEIAPNQERALQRITYQESRRQKNIESIASTAANELRDDQDVSKDPVDPDWMARFLDGAQDISNEQMQFLWGRILAQEVRAPGAFSIRTLETIRNLSRQEAEAFERLIGAAFWASNDIFVPLAASNHDSLLREEFNIGINNIIDLQEAGLVVTGLLNVYGKNEKTRRSLQEYGPYLIRYELPEGASITYPIHQISRAGREIARLLRPTGKSRWLTETLKSEPFKSATIQIAMVTEKLDAGYRHLPFVDFNPDAGYPMELDRP